jgi:hypothetical protein
MSSNLGKASVYLHFLGNIPRAVLPFAMLLVLAVLLRRRSKLSWEPRRRKFRFFSTTLGNALHIAHVFCRSWCALRDRRKDLMSKPRKMKKAT